ncbi:MAG TPA: glycerol-3-phosphate 1-O-acyltransferase PlsY [Bacillota bacterium]|nr:glycerol-3-phosphate 1-O-acyltransferase PlsY [Bacillota bacterium]
MFYLALPLAYLMGAFPTAYVVGKRNNIDITKEGSGNVGGTNTLRVLGWRAGVTVALVDVLKALLPTLIAKQYLGLLPWQVSLIALAAIIGHNWSVFIGFKGGKGIACTIGASLVLFPQALLIALAIAVAVIALTKYVSLGSILLTVLLPVILLLGEYTPLESYDFSYVIFSVVLAVLAVYRHRGNIARLLNGTERKIGDKKK